MTPTQKAIRRDRKDAAEKWHGVISRAAHKVIFRSGTHWTIWVADYLRFEYYPPSGKVIFQRGIKTENVFTAQKLITVIEREIKRADVENVGGMEFDPIDEGDAW